MKNSFKGAVITEQKDNLFGVESVFSITSVCYPESELFEYIFDAFKFQDWQDNFLKRKEDCSDLSINKEKYKEKINKLKEDIRIAKPKITIKIELEKYEE